MAEHEQLAASREADARVAVAMGWTRIQHWKQNDIVRGNAPGKAWEAAPMIVPHYTTDPAWVVPMMDRIARLASGVGAADLVVWDDGSATCYVHHSGDQHAAPTANLAVGAALLAVWEQAKGGKDG